MAFALAAVAVVAAAATAYTTYNQYQQQAKEADYARQIAENNATAANQQAQYQASVKRTQVQRLLAQQRAALGASGADVNTGSPLLLELDSAYQGARDVAGILWEGSAKSTAYGNEARFDAWKSRTASRQALPAAFINGISTGVSTYFGGGGKMPNFSGSSGSGIGQPGSYVNGTTVLSGSSDAGARIPRYQSMYGGQP